jgi:hypothetical protein
VSSWEEHAIDFRLILAGDRWNHKLFTFEVLFHDQYTLVQVSEQHTGVLFLCAASDIFVESCAAAAGSIATQKKIATYSATRVFTFA